jgi:hypothetical protein
MPQYRKKPVVIEAYQLGDENAGQIVHWVEAGGGEAHRRGGPGGGSRKGTVFIHTLEGTMHAEVGDYVIRGVQGEHYPCKPDIFEATYEAVAEPVAAEQTGDTR